MASGDAGPGQALADISNQKTPIHLGMIGLKQLLHCYHVGTEEVRQTLVRECDLIVECKVCRSLYRGLPNFLSHKRHYCKKNYAGSLVRFQDFMSKEDEAAICGTVFGKERFYRDVEEVGKNVSRVKNTERVLTLDSLEQTSVAVSQRIGNADEVEDEPTRKRKAEDDFDDENPAKVQKMRNDAYSDLDGVRCRPVDDNMMSVRPFFVQNKMIKPASNTCVICKVSMAGKNTLNKHMKRKHFFKKVFRQCDKCTKVFTRDATFMNHIMTEHSVPESKAREKVSCSIGLVDKLVYNNERIYDLPNSFAFMKNQASRRYPIGVLGKIRCQKTASLQETSSSANNEEPRHQKVQNTSFGPELGASDQQELAMIGVLALGVSQENEYQRYKCAIHPVFKFKKFASFKEHVVVQHCLQEIKCIKCKSQFTCKDDGSQHFSEWVLHLQSVHGITAETVTKDIKTALRESVLNCPKEVQDLEQIIMKCPSCDNSYGTKRSLKRHLFLVHNVSYDEMDKYLSTLGNKTPKSSKSDPAEDSLNITNDDPEADNLELKIIQCLGISLTGGNFQKYKCFKHPNCLFRKFSTVRDHVLLQHCQDEIKCPSCGVVFDDEDNVSQNFSYMIDHLVNMHDITEDNIEDLKNALCDTLLKDVDELANLAKGRPFKCDRCGGCFTTLRYLKNHYRAIHHIYGQDIDVEISRYLDKNTSVSEEVELWEEEEESDSDQDDLEENDGKTGSNEGDPEEKDEKSSTKEDDLNLEHIILLALGVWGKSDSSYQKFKCYRHPSILFKRFEALKYHILTHHCHEEVKCPICSKKFDVEDILDHLINEHNVNESSIGELETSLQKAMLKNSEDALLFKNKRATSPVPIVRISKLDDDGSNKSAKPVVATRRTTGTILSTFNLEDYLCPVCSKTFIHMYAAIKHLTSAHGYDKSDARDKIIEASEKWRSLNYSETCMLDGHYAEEPEEAETMDVEVVSPSRRKQLSPSKCLSPIVSHSTPKIDDPNLLSIRKISFGAGFSLHKCGTCCKVFGKQAALLVHEKNCGKSEANVVEGSDTSFEIPVQTLTNKGEGKQSCNKCGLSYVDYRSHVLSCAVQRNIGPGNNIFQCSYCQVQFLKKCGLKMHEKVCWTKQPLSTKVIDKKALSDLEEQKKNLQSKLASNASPEKLTSLNSYDKLAFDKKPALNVSSEAKQSSVKAATAEKSSEVVNASSPKKISSTSVEKQKSSPTKLHSQTSPQLKKSKTIKCPVCAETRPDEKGLSVHLKEAHKWSQKRVESISNERSGSEGKKESRADHEENDSDEESAECEKELTMTLDDDRVSCPLCNRKFRNIQKAEHHWKAIHGIDDKQINEIKKTAKAIRKKKMEKVLMKAKSFGSLRSSRRVSEGIAGASLSPSGGKLQRIVDKNMTQ